jgi:hypothetical protein
MQCGIKQAAHTIHWAPATHGQKVATNASWEGSTHQEPNKSQVCISVSKTAKVKDSKDGLSASWHASQGALQQKRTVLLALLQGPLTCRERTTMFQQLCEVSGPLQQVMLQRFNCLVKACNGSKTAPDGSFSNLSNILSTSNGNPAAML